MVVGIAFDEVAQEIVGHHTAFYQRGRLVIGIQQVLEIVEHHWVEAKLKRTFVNLGNGVCLAFLGPESVPEGDALLLVGLGDEEFGDDVGITVDNVLALQRVEQEHERLVGLQRLVKVGGDGGEIQVVEAVVVLGVI